MFDFTAILAWLSPIGEFCLYKLVPNLVLTVVGWLVIKMFVKLVEKALRKSKLEKVAHTLILTGVRTVLYILLALIVASGLGIDVTGVVALASVLTLAVSLSVQNILTNVIGGFTLLYTHPFGSGDYVEIAGQSGTVNEVGIAYTKLITPDNKLVFIPNSAVVSAEIVNYTVTGTRRVDIAISASYDVPVAKVEQVLMEAAQVPGILVDPAPFVSVTGYGDSAIQYVVRVWTKTESYWDVHFAITHSIKEKFDSNDVQMTYPHLNIHIDK